MCTRPQSEDFIDRSIRTTEITTPSRETRWGRGSTGEEEEAHRYLMYRSVHILLPPRDGTGTDAVDPSVPGDILHDSPGIPLPSAARFSL